MRQRERLRFGVVESDDALESEFALQRRGRPVPAGVGHLDPVSQDRTGDRESADPGLTRRDRPQIGPHDRFQPAVIHDRESLLGGNPETAVAGFGEGETQIGGADIAHQPGQCGRPAAIGRAH